MRIIDHRIVDSVLKVDGEGGKKGSLMHITDISPAIVEESLFENLGVALW